MQLVFNENFSNIIDEEPSYYNSLKDIPFKIQNFIRNTIDNIYFYNMRNQKKYCSKCLRLLEKNQCPKCSKVYPQKSIYKYDVLSRDDMLENELSFYFFDFQENELLLYYSIFQQRLNKFTIKNIFKIDAFGLTDVLTNKFYLYKDYQELKSIFTDESYLYVDNLEKLQESPLYKYSLIWEMKEYLSNRFVNLFMLTFYPIHFKQYEYLVKMKLYALACEATPTFVSKIFKENFGVDKTFLPYLQKINITSEELRILKLIPIKNKRILDFFSNNIYFSEKIAKITSLESVYYYLKKFHLSRFYIYEYAKYLEMCQELKLDLHDKDILFPQDFLVTYESISKQVNLIEDTKNNLIIKDLYNVYNINTFEDDTYKIFPASSVEDLIDESSQMNNCVRTYVSNIVSCVSQIFFLRKKDNLDKSLVTVELQNGQIVQALAKNNTTPNKEILSFLDKWKENIIPVVVEKN